MNLSVASSALSRELCSSLVASDLGEWYAVYTRSRHEHFVQRQLDFKQINTFLPSYEKVSQWKDRRKKICLPLFPGYIFVKIVLQERLEVLKAFGVVHFVGGASPLPVPEEQILSIQAFLDNGLTCDPHPYLKVGHRVRIKEGPLSGIEGILVRKKNGLRFVVSVEIIQRSVSIELDSWKVERI